MNRFHFHVGRLDEARDLVETFHYSKRWPSMVVAVGTWHEDGGLFGDYGPCIAACVFSLAQAKWSESVVELTRLVRREDVRPALSGLIGKTCDYIRKQRVADLIISFADKTQQHHGGIYQACSWNYHGARTPSCDGLVVDGTFIPGRSCNALYGSRSQKIVAERLKGMVVERHVDEGKHLYWRALSKDGSKKAVRLGFRSETYPKPKLSDHLCSKPQQTALIFEDGGA